MLVLRAVLREMKSGVLVYLSAVIACTILAIVVGLVFPK